MPEKEKGAEGTAQNTPQQPQEQESLTEAIVKAFNSIAQKPAQSSTVQLEPKKLDYAPDGGRYVVRGQVVDHDGKPVKGYTVVDGEIVKA